MACLDHDEDDEKDEGRAEEPEGSRGGPADLVALDDGVDGEHERRGHGDRAADIELPLPGRRLHARAEIDGEHEDCDSDRDVDEEDPVPAEKVGEVPPSSTPAVP